MRTSQFIKGIAKSIHSVFGDSCTIYVNDIEQGLDEPCFLIKAVRSDFTRGIKGRYETVTSIDLAYFPPYGADNVSMHAVLPDCIRALALIDCDGELVRGTGISSNIIDNVLHISADYAMTLADAEPEAETMDSLKQRIGEKENG